VTDEVAMATIATAAAVDGSVVVCELLFYYFELYSIYSILRFSDIK